jgi:cytochrome c biogenesis protein CcdA
MKILKYSEHNKSFEMAEEFLNIIGNGVFNESDEHNTILKKIIKDLKLNSSIALTFGTGLTAMIPLVNKLVSTLKIDLTTDTVVLITITGLTIAYLEEKKELSVKKRMQIEKDSKSMLEELKLKGVGNGVIKKIVKCIKSIGNIFKILFKNTRHVVNGFFDMFAYSAIAVPVVNAILYMVNKYDMNLETLPSNFLSLGLGVTTIAAKHGLNYLIDLLKDKLKLNKSDILKGINDVDDPILKKYPHPEYIDTEYIDDDSKLIKEQ